MKKKKILLTLLKLGVSLGVVGYLLYSIRTNPKYAGDVQQLITQHKDWRLLGVGWLLLFTSVILTFIRWYWLVRALDLPFHLRDGLRLGFLGLLFNYVSPGSVGGDLFKAVFLAHEHPGRRTEAISTIFVDRIIGLYGLLLLASIAVLSGQLPKAIQSNPPDQQVTAVRSAQVSDPAKLNATVANADGQLKALNLVKKITLITTGAIALLFAVLMWPGLLSGRLANYLCGLSKVGPLVGKLLQAARTYRSRHKVLWASLGITMVLHLLHVFAYYCLALGLSGERDLAQGMLQVPSLTSHMLIIPIAMLISALPISFAGLGVFELAMRDLYGMKGIAPAAMEASLGLWVALVDRIMMLLVAAVGILFYIGGRREVKEVMHEVEEAEESA